MINNWIKVSEKLPECWVHHRDCITSEQIIGFTKYGEKVFTQLISIVTRSGEHIYRWESNDRLDEEFDYITHWMPAPNNPE